MSHVRFRPTGRPRASIVVLAWKQTDLLLACLRSLAQTLSGEVPYEVIVVSNDAPQAILDAVSRGVEGIRLVRAEANLGFAGGCNLGATAARGDYIVLLNDDAVVAHGWLDWLVNTADANSNAGAVGSLILFPDGTVQEAGSIIWSDGSTMPVGRHSPTDSLEWQFVRKVDYVSACSLLVKRDAWVCVGGLDAQYHPAYYEDVDMCLALRSMGRDVLLEPRSRVWHHESTSSDERFKLFLFSRNQKRLHAKWAKELAFHEPPQPQSATAVRRAVWRAQGLAPRILVIDDRIPEPSLGSGLGRMFEALLQMAAGGYTVMFHPLIRSSPEGPPDPLISAGVAILDGNLKVRLAEPWTNFEVIIVSRPYIFEQVAPVIRSLQPWATLVYDCEALFWRRLARQAAITVGPKRSRLEEAATAMKAIEERIVIDADYAVTVSLEEAELLRRVSGCCPVHPLLPAEPLVSFGKQAFHERQGLGYVAGWLAGTTSPNADGLRWFVSEVLPAVRQIVPWVRLNITGANPPPDLLELADAHVHFEGHVCDLEAFYRRQRVIIAPIRFGAGVKVKTIQAIQHGVPVVSTTCGAEGIDADEVAIAIADSAEAFAAALIQLLTDATHWRLRRSAMASVLTRWREQTQSASWPAVISEILARRQSGSHPLLLHR